MRLADLPDDKRREAEIGRIFISAYNESQGSQYALDESYWDQDPDPSPDLRFVSPSQPALFAEVVGFDEDGEEGFIRQVHTPRHRQTARPGNLDRFREMPVLAFP